MLSWRNPVLITASAVTTEQMELIFGGDLLEKGAGKKWIV